jgi:hypothetical protein
MIMNEYSTRLNCSYVIHLGQSDAGVCEDVIFMQPEKKINDVCTRTLNCHYDAGSCH